MKNILNKKVSLLWFVFGVYFLPIIVLLIFARLKILDSVDHSAAFAINTLYAMYIVFIAFPLSILMGIIKLINKYRERKLKQNL